MLRIAASHRAPAPMNDSQIYPQLPYRPRVKARMVIAWH
jgi:hypothetical protein